MPPSDEYFKEIYRKVYLGGDIGKHVTDSMKILEDALLKYGPEGIAMSFNGGKDCTVMLTIYCAVLYQYRMKFPMSKFSKIPTLYAIPLDPFKEAELFISDCESRYCLNILRSHKPIREALSDFKNHFPNVHAIIIGTRSSDPHASHLTSLLPTDPGWTPMMRIHPILQWHFADIWAFLRELRIPYCVLYDRGYTSLGGQHTTRPNPHLLKPDGTYSPAYLLLDENKEREGRLDLNVCTK